jgi:preprotein translocase subunit YajC
MSKKNWTAGLFALALTLGIVSVAAAAGPSLADPPALSGSTLAPLGAAAGIDPQDPPNPPGPRGGPGRGPLRGRPHLSGEITAIGDNQFTLTTAGNNEVTVEVDESTSYLGSLDGFDDLEVGLDVAVAGQRSDEGTVLARAIAARDDLPFGTRLGGEVTAVGSDTLTIETRRGETFTFDVTADTDFLSRDNSVTGLEDIEVGDHVLVLFEQSDSGGLTAKVIFVSGPPPEDASN